ncbi:M12 family metallo-peptidase [Dyadobacter chenwenxiniae]|uniref:M12 family metallo-peptidase n=1 Tax=Dyadobacter chenwenxiniae TaxID=2906456 RepID=A0A9X1PIC1_9BACT|nr:zinc-dependent metalloprotease [Dyadobacter chenwenxiniae]MCF0060619.1 M12 family metallo-peptidase [Dyadobacter chenwenxiniae]UON80451.1 M12 family metallo-peptidase [Dyadobacter chenwenxiniae]
MNRFFTFSPIRFIAELRGGLSLQSKQPYLAVLLLLVAISSVVGQSTGSETDLFTVISKDEVSLQATVSEKINKMNGSRLYQQIVPVKIGRIPRIQKNGVLTFSIPGSQEKFTFIAQKVNAESDLDFVWYGHSKDYLSTATFISEKGAISGAFNVGKRYFQVYTLDDGISILQEDRTDITVQCSSGEHGYAKPDTIVQPSIPTDKGARMGVCTEPTRVLVVYTQAAANSVANIGQTINLSVQQYNQTLANSGVSTPQTNNIVLTGTQLVNFAGANDPEGTPDAEQAAAFVRDNANIQNLRNQHNADLVICMVEREYNNGAIGSVVVVPASNVNYAAIVRGPFSSAANFFTFTHELGHLMGGRHQTDPGPPSYSHGFAFAANGAFRTMMHTFQDNSNRIMHFSSPNVNFNGVPTGTSNVNHVARVISETSLNVVNFRPSVTQPFNATIIGPTSINTAGWYDWELYFFCQPLGSTTWQFSTDGFNYGSPVGFGDAVNFYNIDASNNGTLFLRCIINNGGQNYVTTTTINVNICSGCRQSSEFVTASTSKELVTDVKAVYPNPADKVLTVDFSLSETSDVELELLDITGQKRVQKTIKGVAAGSHKHFVELTSLNSGMYICKFKSGTKTTARPFVVLK